jgi:alkylresorcinol/alkylpyrone synthase
MSRLVDIVIAPPACQLAQADAETFARETFGGARRDLQRLLPVFVNVGVRTRQICRPIDWYKQDHDFGERNAVYVEEATTLCARAGRELLERNKLLPSQIDRIIYVNTTGLATPSIDARLINLLGLRKDVRRTPIWGLGCAGGASGLAHAHEHLVARPRERVLLFAAEMCSLTLLRDDAGSGNIVATALFADGAAAALLSGDETGDEGYPVLDSRSTLYPDSLGVMGWHVVARGLQVVFDRRIPRIVTAHAAEELDAFLGSNNLSRRDVTEYLYHPGGPKVLAAYAAAYGVEAARFHWSYGVLAQYGNMSSVTILYVIERYMRAHRPGRGGYAVLSALGPGFSSEMLLLGL